MKTVGYMALLCAAVLAACTAGPDYQRPPAAEPAAFKYAQGWRPADSAALPAAGPWWQPLAAPRLDELLREVDVSSQTLAQAEARYRQAQALLAGSRAGLWPRAGAEAGATRNGAGSGSAIDERYSLGLTLSWVPDLWGRVRRGIEASDAQLQVSAADLAAARLSLQAAIATGYIQLRVLDRQRTLLEQTLDAYQRSLALTANQYRAGLVKRSDAVQAETQVEAVRLQLLDIERRRAQQENALAALSGRAPVAFAIAADGSLPALPAVPAQLPSALLQRRPDIVSAERGVAAANARIGIAASAWFPELTLSARGGYDGLAFADWVNAPNRVWSVGPALALTLFDGGARRAQSRQAEAAYDEQVAFYRQTVLDGLREVEDALVYTENLERLAAQQDKVVALAEENERLVTNQYRAGMVTFLEVAVAQNTTLTSRRAALDIAGDRLAAGVQLIVALGGGWQADEAIAPVGAMR